MLAWRTRWHGLGSATIVFVDTFRGSAGALLLGRCGCLNSIVPQSSNDELCGRNKSCYVLRCQAQNNLKYRLPVKTGSHNGVHLNSDCNYTLARRANIKSTHHAKKKIYSVRCHGLNRVIVAKSAGAHRFR